MAGFSLLNPAQDLKQSMDLLGRGEAQQILKMAQLQRTGGITQIQPQELVGASGLPQNFAVPVGATVIKGLIEAQIAGGPGHANSISVVCGFLNPPYVAGGIVQPHDTKLRFQFGNGGAFNEFRIDLIRGAIVTVPGYFIKCDVICQNLGAVPFNVSLIASASLAPYSGQKFHILSERVTPDNTIVQADLVPSFARYVKIIPLDAETDDLKFFGRDSAGNVISSFRVPPGIFCPWVEITDQMTSYSIDDLTGGGGANMCNVLWAIEV